MPQEVSVLITEQVPGAAACLQLVLPWCSHTQHRSHTAGRAFAELNDSALAAAPHLQLHP